MRDCNVVRSPEVLEVLPGRHDLLDQVTAAMDELTAAQGGWITLQPGVHPDDAPPPTNILSKVLTGSGPPVPVCTWVAPERKQKPPHAEIGILHARGAKAEKRLAERELAVPDRWVVLADHSKRGLVVAVHPDAASADVLAWLLEAGAALTRIPLTGSWRVEIHRP
jgi:hypothetical protein